MLLEVHMFGHGLKMCMLLVYNPQIMFVVFHKFNLVVFQALLLSQFIDIG